MRVGSERGLTIIVYPFFTTSSSIIFLAITAFFFGEKKNNHKISETVVKNFLLKVFFFPKFSEILNSYKLHYYRGLNMVLAAIEIIDTFELEGLLFPCFSSL